MFAILVVFLLFSSSSASVLKHVDNSCGPIEFMCHDGGCISMDLMCDGVTNCADASDETSCGIEMDLNVLENPVLHRSRRQARCRSDSQWRCRDGTCVSFDKKCDGTIDCPDKSDESFAACRNEGCQSNLFRCAYGACVDGTAPCNGIQECADNSDELLSKCRNVSSNGNSRFHCDDGSFISESDKCDGIFNCPDQSDETVKACADKTCPGFLFRCAYGGCVDGGSECNGVKDCADNSDEDDYLCNRIGVGTTTTTTAPKPTGSCVLPQYPNHGTYTVSGVPNARPGQVFEYSFLNVSCQNGYGLNSKADIYCYDGIWSNPLPTCVKLCKLNLQRPDVEYRCIVQNTMGGYRKCDPAEPVGTIVEPNCKTPIYYSPTNLPIMRCIDGEWDYNAVCVPECGRVTPAGEQLVIGGKAAKHGELPWHVGIYRKNAEWLQQICGGSLVSNTLVISAAHCFWDDTYKKMPPNLYAVAAGKLYRQWNDPRDKDAQKSDVADIVLPVSFFGAERNFAEDIALVIISRRFEYKTYLRPVCMDFSPLLEAEQLSGHNMGKAAGWGLISVDGKESPVLKVVDLPFVEYDECIARAPPNYREHITHDKICAGYDNGTALCKGDSGGGLVFPSQQLGVQRYFLRGIVSTAPANEHLCNDQSITSFTRITIHEKFIKRYYSPF